MLTFFPGSSPLLAGLLAKGAAKQSRVIKLRLPVQHFVKRMCRVRCVYWPISRYFAVVCVLLHTELLRILDRSQTSLNNQCPLRHNITVLILH